VRGGAGGVIVILLESGETFSAKSSVLEEKRRYTPKVKHPAKKEGNSRNRRQYIDTLRYCLFPRERETTRIK